MAWIELHQSLPRHRKTLVVAAHLGIHRIQAMGHLAALWMWAIDNAEDGDLTGVPAQVIAFGAEWDGDAQAFVDALIAAGFLERQDGRLLIHDWWDYAGQLIERRRRDRERKRRERAQKQRRASEGQLTPEAKERPQDVQRTSTGHPSDVRAYRTVPNHDDDDDDSARAREEVAAARPPAAWPALFERVTGHLIGSLAYDRFCSFADEMGDEVVCEALKRAQAAHANNPAQYADGILVRWQQHRVRSLADIQRLDASYEKRKRQGAGARADPDPEEHLTVDELQRRRRERGEYVDGPDAETVRELARAIGRTPT